MTAALRVALAPRHAWRAARARRAMGRRAGTRLLRAFGEAYPEACFVEIGSNDGDQHDHLRPMILTRPWRGIMVEPVPYVFERLRHNYAGLDRVALENVAIADRDGEMPFHHLAQARREDEAILPSWYDAIGSFSREGVLGHAHRIPDIEARLVTTTVPCLTFDSLCRRHGLSHVDLLLLDTEGHDFEILRHVDLSLHSPRLVIYEHFHLSSEDRAACRSHLERAGYETMEEGFDTWCLRTPPQDGLTRAWRRLRPTVAGVSVHDPVP